MKRIVLALLSLTLCLLSAQARTLTAVADGNWTDPSTWSPAAVPTNNDLVYIPNNRIVSVVSNIAETGSVMDIRIGGLLRFIGGGAKLRIAGGSIVYVYPAGRIYANQNSQVIIIGGTTVLNASNSGTTVTGPSAATASSSSNSTNSSTTPTGFSSYSPSALPVAFLSFTASRQGSDVLVQFSTATEENADRFDVEISKDGRNWSSFGSLRAAGNSSSVRNYSFTARNLNTTIQVRIKQVDIDGKFTYTAIRTVAGTASANVQVAAASGRVILQFGSEVKDATVRIMNLNGQVLQEQKLASAIGQVLVPTNYKGLGVVTVLAENGTVAAQKVVL